MEFEFVALFSLVHSFIIHPIGAKSERMGPETRQMSGVSAPLLGILCLWGLRITAPWRLIFFGLGSMGKNSSWLFFP